VSISKNDAVAMGPQVYSLLKDFCLGSQKNDMYFPVSALGPNALDISFFLNHSDAPNVAIDFKGCDMSYYIAGRDIKQGEELTIDYKQFDFPDSLMIEHMPFLFNSGDQTVGGKSKKLPVKRKPKKTNKKVTK
jgi:SET domain-containing protein